MRPSYSHPPPRRRRWLHLLFGILLVHLVPLSSPSLLQSFPVLEGTVSGTLIGTIGASSLPPGLPGLPSPPYLIVPRPESADHAERDLAVDQNTGEIRTKRTLDREVVSEYRFSAIPLNGEESIEVIVTVGDVNDNTPVFEVNEITLDIPENTPVGSKRKLSPAFDADQGTYGTQSYHIESGNEDGSFVLSVNKDREGKFKLELIVNGDLDRERTDSYELHLVAVDGGSPPKTGTMTINVKIQDLNDNPPTFSKQRYFTAVSDDLQPGDSVFKVTANDQDQGVNSLIQYSINRKQSDKDRFFRIDANTGLISLDKRLDFDRTQVHEIVVVARDGGVVPQETSAFVTVRLTKDRSQVTQRTNSKNRPTVKLVYANGRGTVPENSPVGSAFAQVTLAGNSGDLSALNFDLSQSERVFELTKNGSGLYLATLKKLDFEKQSLYTVTIDVTDPVQPVKSFQETIDIAVEDHNDHAPVFKKQSYSAFVEESVEPGSSVIQVQATDEDEGHNGEVTYSLQYSGSEASDWFQVDEQSGLVTTQTFLDCETESQPKVIIVASDNGYHKLSSTATLSVSVNDVNDNQPLFEKSFYEAEVPENMSPGDCFLNVKANDLDCGQNAEVKYRIKESTSMFSVEEKTGKICLMEELDHERQEVYGFTVIATDRGSLSTSTMVKVDIKDINDNFPQFKPEQYITKIRSRFPTGVNILTVNAFDGDSGMAGTVRYEMVSGNEDGQFNLDKTLGKISLAKPLAARDHFQLVLDVFDGEGLQGLAEAKVMIIVDDDDLTFKMPQFHFEIYEDVSPYSEIGKVEAKTGQRGARMEIYESNVERYVSIDPLTGILRTEARMDHERHPEVILNIRLEDNAQRTESFCQVVVSIKDVNDNAPEFGSTTAMATIAEDFPVGRSIYIGKAIDADSGKNGDIIYSLASGPGKEYFSIDRQSGQVTLMKPLDFESQQEHKVLIEAEDMGSPSLKSTLKLLVHVHDVNDNKPHFEKDFFSVNLSESHPINTPVVTIKARDADHGRSGKISYSVSDNQYVSILQSTGVLILKKPLDRESKKSVDVTVTAKDHGVPSLQDTARVQLLITDRNDNSPSFEDNDYRFSTIEGLPYGTFVGAVRATDQDEGINGNVEYDFKNSVENFVINKVTGRISTGKVLDREEIDQYELIVEATDLGRPRRSSQTVVIIVVEDINDNPPRLVDPQNRMLYIQQGSGIGTIIGKLHAEDPDSGNTRITYKVLDANPTISVDSNGEVRLLQSLSHSGKSYNAHIHISDNGSPSKSVQETIQLSVVDEKDGNLSLGQSTKTLSVDESSPIGTRIGSVASRTSGGSRYSYTLVTSNVHVEKSILVDKLRGDLIVIGKLNADKVPEFNFDIRVVNLDGDTSPSSVTVRITVNQKSSVRAPRFTENPSRVDVAESARVGTRVVNLEKLTSNDSNSRNVNFEIVDQTPGDAFKLEPNSGQLVVARNLDYEQVEEYLVTVRGFSGEKFSADLSVVVSVKDVNDNRPKFWSSDTISLSPDTPLETTFMKLVVSDEDTGQNGEVITTIVAGNYENIFQLDPKTHELKLSKPLTSKTFELTIRAEDMAEQSLYTTQDLTILVTTGDDSSPRFEKSVYYAQITENSSPDSKVLTVALNRNGRYIYSLLKGEDRFYIDERSGDVKTVSSLDREEEETHALIVSVHDEDNAGITDTAVVYVTVDDVNDNAPEFGHNCRDISIPENSQHSFVHAFVASDRDSGDNGEISYSLKSVSQQFSNKFRIEKDTGKLFSMPLDREEQQDYRLEIIAVDHGAGRLTTKCELTIKVIDENDNSPSFSQSIYSASVKEDIARDTEVLKVLATDADSGDNAKVLYSIENASHWSFSIDKNTGRIFTTAALDREAVDEIRFDVLATDKGEHNIRSSRTKVKIIVTDANDHKPEFTEYPFKINMTATPSSGVSLLKLTALDPDIGPNGQLAYNLVRPEQRNRFHLSPEEGILAVASTEIAWEPGTVETLEVAVSDAGNPPRSSTGLIEIKIEGGPAINLEFEEELYSAEIQENPQSGQDVTQVKAVRSDGRRQRVIYTFLRGNELGAFEINSNNGLIRVRAPELVDYEQQTEFNLTISGQGLGDDELTAYTTCIVKVKDINDQAPKFNREVYNTKIPEGSNKGTEVVVLTATDQDVSETKPLRYDIIDGNLDGAFTVDPNKPGVILTNIVLDREIKDMYELTVSVTDSGTPPLVGLTQLVVKVIDTNDNKPHFGFIPPIEVESDTVPGSVVYVLRANDIDIAPAVTYKLERPNKFFIVDTYTGQLLLLRHPRQDEGKKTSFVVLASDTQHEVEAKVTVTFKQSELTCKPEFSDPLYTFYASLNDTFPKGLGEIEVTSCNEHELSVARKDRSYFNILTNGTLVLNRLPREDITSILITATDRVSDEKTSAVVTLSKNEGTMAPIDLSEVFPDTIKFSSSTLNGPVLMQKASEFPTEDLVFSITENPIFQIDSKTGSIFQVFKKSSVDNVPKDLTVTAKRLSDNMIKTKSLGVIVDGHSSGLKPDHFTLERVTTTLEEDAKINTQIDICSFASHSAGTPFIKIVSGNEGQTFLFDEDKAKLILNKPLDFEAMDTRSIVLKMGSNGKFSLCTVIILVTNVNDFVPYFPITEFVTSIPENSPVGSPIKAPPLVDLDPNDRLIFWTRSSKFHVNSRTGEISTREVFDYEDVSDHYLDLYVNDTAGHLSQCRVQVMVESQDEFPPIFEQNNYYFSIPGLASVGDVVGQVKAQDRDQGADGYVSYSFTTSNQYLSIDSARGVVTVSKDLDTGIFSNSITGNALSNRRRKRAIRDLRVVVNAKSKQPHSLESSTLLTISVEAALLPVAVDPSAGMSSMVLGILVGFVIIIIVLLLALLWFCKRKQDREKEARKMALLAHNASAASAHGDRRGGQTNMAMELNSTASSSDALSRFPPQYSEIVSDYESRTKMKTNRSEISEKSHRSASSGRGSVEDGEEEVDVEIRMINEGSFLPPDSSYAMDAEDKMSEGSVQNTEEYLARLGIDMRKPPNMNSTAGGSTTGGGGDMVHNFDNNYTVGGGGPGSSIYNRIPDDTMSEKSSVMNAKQHSLIYGSRGQPSIAGSLSSIVHSEEELAGSYNWDYLLDWGPQYQPLAHVFKEISKLKDDEGPSPGPATQNAVMSVAATTPGSGGSMLSAEASGGNSGMPYGITGVKKNPRTSHLLLPRSTRSPISHDMLSSQNALSPNFHPALSPLATKSPSVSPLSVPNLKGGNRGPVVHHQRL